MKSKSNIIINAKEAVPKFLETILYCIKLSWDASAFYTIVRLAGRILTPVLGIISSFLAKYIIDLLAGSWKDKTSSLAMLLAGTLIIALTTTSVRKITHYCQTMHKADNNACYG
mgnify:CR=1 FL=1